MKPLVPRLMACLAASLLASSVGAQALVLGVSEGTSGGLDHAQAIVKYRGLADSLSRAVKQPVNVVFAREFSLLEGGMKAGRFDFVFARPSDYPARGMRDYGYQYVASAKPDGQCFIIVPKGSPIQKISDVQGKRIVLPEKVAYMTKFCTAALRDQGIDLAKERVDYLREQAAVAFYLENKFADVGGVASYSSIAKKWEPDGHRVLYKSPPQPYFPLIADKRFKPEQVRAMQQELQALADNEAGQQVLKTIGVQRFDTTSEAKLRDLLGWLGK